MRRFRQVVPTVAVVLTAVLLIAAEPEARVRLELVTEEGFPITGAQQWYELFSELGVAGLQIRSATARDEVGIEQRGTKNAPEYRVVGVLSADNTLRLPGGKFTVRDGAKLKKWLENLSVDGAEGVTQSRSAFGLLPGQLQQVNDDLKQPIAFPTQGADLAQAVDKLRGQLKFPLQVDREAGGAMIGVSISEDLQGMATGTALAVMLRPAGLVLEPTRPEGGQLHYRIGKPRQGAESWPIGWKPQERPAKVLPDLFEFINVEINEITLAEALEAIQSRLKIPFLFDHNALALHGIDPAQIEVSIPGKRLTYSLILQRLLSQAKLKSELRLDENNKPFLWITSIKPI